MNTTTSTPPSPGRADQPTVDQLAARGLHPGARDLRRVPDDWVDRPYPFSVRPMSPTIGAELGVDLADLAPGTDDAVDERWAEVHRALLEWKVLVFRDQDLDGPTQRAVASRWGELERHPFLPAGSSDDVVRFEKNADTQGYENLWHTDVTWRERPAMAAVLRAVEVPPVGGDTLWADMAAAYDGLPSRVRRRIDPLVAVNDFAFSFGSQMDDGTLAEFRERFPAVEHPVVRVHPETGRRTLFVNAVFTSRIVGLEPDDSEELLRLLFRQAEVPEYQCRLAWRPGTVAMWDNRATQHYAVNDYHPQRRIMERVAIVGDRPA
jgi:taurine dioxygenase